MQGRGREREREREGGGGESLIGGGCSRYRILYSLLPAVPDPTEEKVQSQLTTYNATPY